MIEVDEEHFFCVSGKKGGLLLGTKQKTCRIRIRGLLLAINLSTVFRLTA